MAPPPPGCLPRPLGLTLASSHSTCLSRTSPHPGLPPTTHKGGFPALPPVPPASCQRTSACRQCCEPGRTLLAGHRWQGLPWNQLPGLRALVTLRQQRQHPPVRRPDKQPAREPAAKKHPNPVDSAESNVLPQRKAEPRCRCRHCLPQHPQRSARVHLGGCLPAGTPAVDRGRVRFSGWTAALRGRGLGGSASPISLMGQPTLGTPGLRQERGDTGLAPKGMGTTGRG